MCARRDVLYKRSHSGARLALFPRLSPSVLDKVSLTPAATPSAPPQADPQTSNPFDPFNNPFEQKTSDTPTASSSATTSSLSAPATSSTPSSSSSPTSRSSSTSTSSSATPTALSSSSTPLTVASPTAVNAPTLTTHVVAGVTFTPTTASLSPTTTSSAGSSGGIHTSTIVGGVAGTLAAIAALGFLLMWCMRRQRDQDIDDFDAQAFKRQSAMLVDDHVEPPRSYNPRPPTMIEHHNTSPALVAQAAYGGQNFYGGYSEYSQRPSHVPPEMNQPIHSPPPQAYGAPSMGYTGYNDPQQQIVGQSANMGHPSYDPTQQLARQPSNVQYLTRLPSSAAGHAPPTALPASHDPDTQYIDLNRSSVSPYQAVQYADISRQLGTTDPNAQVPHESADLLEGPLPSPFDDPAEGTSVPSASSNARLDNPTDAAAPGSATVVPSPQAQGSATQSHQRPPTIYEVSDAYAGI